MTNNRIAVGSVVEGISGAGYVRTDADGLVLDPGDSPSIATADIAAGAVTTPKLADDAVTTAKMADGTAGSLLGYSSTGAAAVITPKVFDASGYGATGDGTTDDTTALAALFTAASGATARLASGRTYKTTSQLTLPAGTILDLNGATISAAHTGYGIYIAGSNVTIQNGFITKAADQGVYAAGSMGIYAIGTVNGAGVAPTKITNLRFMNLNVSGFGHTGINILYASDVLVTGCYISTCGYSGVTGLSVDKMIVQVCTVDGLTGATSSGNAYGIAFTSVSDADFVRYPVSEDCLASSNIVKNVTSWHGIDTHAGERIVFEGNTVSNCRRGIILTYHPAAGPTDCRVINNVIQTDLTGTNAFGADAVGDGIWDIGATGALATRNIISNNNVYQHGGKIATGAGLFIECATGGTYSGNVFKECTGNGIYISSNVTNPLISGNVFFDTKSAGTGAGAPTDQCPGIRISANTTITGITIAGNVFARKNTAAAAFVQVQGIVFETNISRTGRIVANTFDGVTTPYSGATTGFTVDSDNLAQDFAAGITGTTGTFSGLLKSTGGDLRSVNASGSATVAADGSNNSSFFFRRSAANKFEITYSAAGYLVFYNYPAAQYVLGCHDATGFFRFGDGTTAPARRIDTDGFRLRSTAEPGTPANGDFWNDSGTLKVRSGGVWVTI